jgi:hypothetical protein
MDYKCGAVGIKQVSHLKESPAAPATDYVEFVITGVFRIRRLRIPHDHLRFFLAHAVLGDVVAVPVDPAKLHRATFRLFYTNPFTIAF